MKILLFCFFFSFFYDLKSSENTLSIALSSNFLFTFNTISKEFENKNNCKIFFSSDSSANLYFKIKNGAKFDIFITADEVYSNMLYKFGHKSYFEILFLGKLSIFSKNKSLNKNFLINLSIFKKIALSNKKLAPYGYAAFEFFDNTRINYDDFVFGNNVNQTFVFVDSFNSDVGFINLSHNMFLKTSREKYIKLPSYTYFPIKQKIIFFNSSFCIDKFFEFSKSNLFKNIIESDGYKFKK